MEGNANFGIPIREEIFKNKHIDLRCVLYLKSKAAESGDGLVKINHSQWARDISGEASSSMRNKIDKTQKEMISLGFYEKRDKQLLIKKDTGYYAQIKKENVEQFYTLLSNYELRIYAYLKDRQRGWRRKHPGEYYCFTKKELQVKALGMSKDNESKYIEPTLDSLVLKGLIKYGITYKINTKGIKVPYRVLLAVNEHMTMLDQIQKKREDIFRNLGIKEDFSLEEDRGKGIEITDDFQEIYVMGIDEEDIQENDVPLLKEAQPKVYPFPGSQGEVYMPIEKAYESLKNDKIKLANKLKEFLELDSRNKDYIKYENNRLKLGLENFIED